MNGFQDRTPPLEFRLACGPSVPLGGEEAGFPRSCPCYSETQVSPLYDGRGYNERRNRGDGPARHVRPRERTPRRARATAAAGEHSRTELQTVTATVCIARLVVFSGLPSFASAELLERGRASFPRGAGTARGPRTGRMGRTGFARRVRPACRARSFRALLNAKPRDRHDSPGWRRATAPRFSAPRDQVVRPRSHSSRWGPQTPG